MAARVCGWCGTTSVMYVVWRDVEWSWPVRQDHWLVTATYICDACSCPSVAFYSGHNQVNSPPANDNDAVDRAIIAAGSNVTWSPLWKDKGADFPDVPDGIAAVAKEASACHVDGRYHAAVMLARAVIEASAKAMGATSGQLFQKIEKLDEERVLTPVVVEAAHAIRDSGNAVAHGDFVEYVSDISEVESAEVVALMGLVLRDCFQTAAQARRVRDAATARKNRA